MTSTTTSPDLSTVEIRRPRPTDINQIIDLDLKCFDDPWDYTEWRETLSCQATSVACKSGKVIGISASYVENDCLILTKIAVRKDYRRRKVATRLLKVAEDYADLRGCLEAGCLVPESIAYEFAPWFVKQGFKARRVVRNEFDREDGITFTKLL